MNSLGIFVATVLVALAYGDSLCKQQTVCSCVTDKGTIDLTPLTKSVFRTNDRDGLTSLKYTPCNDNTTLWGCKDALLCKHSMTANDEVIGKAAEVTFTQDKNGIYAINYQGDGNTTSIVTLKCDKNEASEGFLSLTSSGDVHYLFELKSAYACLKPTTASTTKKATTMITTPKTPKTTTKPAKTTTKNPKTTTKPAKTTTNKPKSTTKNPKTTTKNPKTTTKPAKTTSNKPKSTTKNPKTTSKKPKTTPKKPKTTMTTPKHETTTNSATSISVTKLPAMALLIACIRMFY